MQEGTPIIIKKVKKGGHGHHGGAWKVAYADFVTAMMAFFMVMWILGMSQPEKEAIAAYFSDPSGVTKQVPTYQISLGPMDKMMGENSGSADSRDEGIMRDKAEMDKTQAELNEAIEEDPDLKSLAAKGDLEVSQTSEGLVLELIENEAGGEVFFTVGSSGVRDQAKKVFEKLAPVLAATGRLIKVDGHTDARPFPGSGYDNFDLSAERANAVRRLFLTYGVKKSQIIGVEGKADTDLRKPEDPYHFSNRRVTVLLPYRFMRTATQKMPTDIADESVEGVFVKPKGLSPVDAVDRAFGEAEAKKKAGENGHDGGH
jgi:chemotaxis protein MotB